MADTVDAADAIEEPKKGKKTLAQQTEEANHKIAMLNLRRAEMDMDDAEENLNRRTAQKRQNKILGDRVQLQARQSVRTRQAIAKVCRHRQGGTAGNPYQGKGPTALNEVKFPDGTALISCLVCKMEVFSPNVGNQSKKLKPGEKPAERDARVAKFIRDKRRFDRLRRWMQENALTPEAAAAMDSGMRVTFSDEDGNVIHKERPCDTYLPQVLQEPQDQEEIEAEELAFA